MRAIRTKTPVDSAPLPHASPRLEITRDDHTCSSWTTNTIRSVPHTRAASAYVAMAARRAEAEAAATVSGRLIKDSACPLARPFRREFDDKPVRRYRTPACHAARPRRYARGGVATPRRCKPAQHPGRASRKYARDNERARKMINRLINDKFYLSMTVRFPQKPHSRRRTHVT